MNPEHILESLQQQVNEAAERGHALNLCGGGSKQFYGRAASGQTCDLTGYAGIIEHEPSELVVTARAGTSLKSLNETLLSKKQMLPFEPPAFSEQTTIGGVVAAGLSGPRRAYAGSTRDFVLGIRCLNGKGQVLGFGGQVMKNVAGFDLSRLLTGSLGTLGIILEVSLKLLPIPQAEKTCVIECDRATAIKHCRAWAAKPLPISATAHIDGSLYYRVSGMASAVEDAHRQLGGDDYSTGDTLWSQLRDHQHEFFTGTEKLWRLSLPPASDTQDIPGHSIMEWGGGLYWLVTDRPDEEVFAYASGKQGHATLFRGGDRNGTVFTPLQPGILKLHTQLKKAFDPKGIFNPGRMYADL